MYESRHINGLTMYVRPHTTDDKVIDEVIKRNCYQKKSIGFFIEEGDRWLDLGGNIGTFALLVLSKGGTVHTVEPEPDNIKLLRHNLEANFKSGWSIGEYCVSTNTNPTESLYLCKGDYNKYMHKLGKVRGRSSIEVDNINILALLNEYNFNSIKIDIEGSEIEILETITHQMWSDYGIDKLVFEYSFNCDASIARFIKIVRQLEKHFKTVKYNRVNESEEFFTYWPNGVLVHCIV